RISAPSCRDYIGRGSQLRARSFPTRPSVQSTTGGLVVLRGADAAQSLAIDAGAAAPLRVSTRAVAGLSPIPESARAAPRGRRESRRGNEPGSWHPVTRRLAAGRR